MLQHVSIEVEPGETERCAAFYELLGFARVEPPESLRERAVWLERRGTQIHLLRASGAVVPPRAHHALIPDDYAQTLVALRDAGFEPEAREPHWGSPRSYVRDPAGHRVELMATSPSRSTAP